MSTQDPTPPGRGDRDPSDDPRDDAESRDTSEPRHGDLQAEVRERADGANAEQVTDEANLRADPDPPGVNAQE